MKNNFTKINKGSELAPETFEKCSRQNLYIKSQIRSKSTENTPKSGPKSVHFAMPVNVFN